MRSLRRVPGAWVTLFLLAAGATSAAQQSATPSPQPGGFTPTAVRSLAPLDPASGFDPSELGGLPRSGVVRAAGFTPGTVPEAWQVLPDGGLLWSMRLASPGARGLRLHFADVDLAGGGELYVYDPADPRGAEGPYQGTGPGAEGFWTSVFDAEALVIEYRLPPGAPDLGDFHLDKLAHLTHNGPLTGGGFGGSNPCHNDATCFPAWHPLHNATARIDFILTAPWGAEVPSFCSAALLNTSAGDDTPYLITAGHCIPDQGAAETLTARWFWQTETCGGATAVQNTFPTSSFADLLIRDGGDFAGSDGTDTALLLLRGGLPAGVQWADWDPAPTGLGVPVTGIHHPVGDLKKISFGPTTASLPGIFTDPELFVIAAFTSGTIEGGSSGSPLYRDDTLRYVGVSSHRLGLCPGTSPEPLVAYGRFSRFYADYPEAQTLLAAGSDDAFEPNDTCADAAGLPNGASPELVVKSTSEDWYAFELGPGGTASIELEHTHVWGDVELELYDACQGTLLAADLGSSDHKTLQVANAGGQPAAYRLRVFLGSDTRNTYRLTADLDAFLAAPDPGLAGAVNTLAFHNGTPAGLVALVYGRGPGTTSLPSVCPGLSLDLAHPKVAATERADALGQVLFSGWVAPALSGQTLHLQAVDLTGCGVSDRLEVAFP